MEGMLLAITTDEMRVAVAGHEDAAHFRRIGGYWTSEAGERIDLESIVFAEGESGLAGSAPKPKAMAFASGQSLVD